MARHGQNSFYLLLLKPGALVKAPKVPGAPKMAAVECKVSVELE